MAADRIGYFAFVVLGACVLLPYNCLLLGQPYFNDHPFQGKQFPFTSMISYSVCLCTGQAFLTLGGELFSVATRMLVSNVGTVLVCAAFIFLTFNARSVGSAVYIWFLAAVAVLGLLNALMQTTLMGLAGSIGQDMSGAVMLGFGISGFLSLALSLIMQLGDSLGVFGDHSPEAGGFLVTVTAFGFCLMYTLFSSWMYLFLSRRAGQAREAIGALERRRSSRVISRSSSPNLSLQKPSPDSSPNSLMDACAMGGDESLVVSTSSGNLRKTFEVLKEVCPQATNVWLVFATTMSIFPGIVTLWLPEPHSILRKELFGTLLIGCFQIFDVVGRSVAGCSSRYLPPAKLWIFVVLRLLFVPVFILGQRQPEWCFLWGSDLGRLFIVAALAFTNGLLASCAMMFGPQRCDDENREVAGMAMSCIMVCGIFAGSLLALLTQLGIHS